MSNVNLMFVSQFTNINDIANIENAKAWNLHSLKLIWSHFCESSFTTYNKQRPMCNEAITIPHNIEGPKALFNVGVQDIWGLDWC